MEPPDLRPGSSRKIKLAMEPKWIRSHDEKQRSWKSGGVKLARKLTAPICRGADRFRLASALLRHMSASATQQEALAPTSCATDVTRICTATQDDA